NSEPINAPPLRRIASGVNSRGPDSCDIRHLDEHLNNTTEGSTALFFNRLAIIDLDKRSDQPFEDANHLLVFNGEIYNYPEIKAVLEKEGAIFRTSSDTEVLFFALKYWGKEALNKLNGMFAFFWLDRETKT